MIDFQELKSDSPSQIKLTVEPVMYNFLSRSVLDTLVRGIQSEKGPGSVAGPFVPTLCETLKILKAHFVAGRAEDAAGSIDADGASAMSLAVKELLLSLVDDSCIPPIVLAEALDVLFEGWHLLGGTPDELARIKKALIDRVMQTSRTSDVQVTIAQTVLKAHWNLLMPSSKERISTLVELLGRTGTEAEAGSFLVELLLETLCKYHNFVSSLEELGAFMPLVVEFCHRRCLGRLASQSQMMTSLPVSKWRHKSGFEMSFALNTFGAGGRDQNASQIQHNEVLNPI